MKKIYCTLLLVFCCAGMLIAQQKDNILSYYAVGNSLDGQPMVDMENTLRFYPVFALREQTDSVCITVYYGPYKYIRPADKKDGGRYWEALLPKFQLGQAIQRFEVEAWITFTDHPLLGQYDSLIVEWERAIKALRDAVDNTSGMFSTAIDANLGQLSTHIQGLAQQRTAISMEMFNSMQGEPAVDPYPASVENLLCAAEKICRKLDASCSCIDRPVRDELLQTIHRLRDISRMKPWQEYRDSLRAHVPCCDNATLLAAMETGEKKLARVNSQLESSLDEFQQGLHDNIRKIIRSELDEAGKILVELTAARDSLRERIAAENTEMLRDTLFSGPSVRRADIILSKQITKARILYRNYKTSLRSMPALDPAESMGIFRLRYIPFVVNGRNYRSTFDGSGAVFEVGLGFGDVAVSGDDFVKPELSIRRLGVAFAITRELFSDQADIRALALTYDFNSYGSIGVGMNFPRTSRESYFSLGINKQAFEDLLAGIVTLFE